MECRCGSWLVRRMPNQNGHIVPIYNRHSATADCDSLRDFHNETVTLRLPDPLDIKDVFWFSVYSIPRSQSLAHIYLPYIADGKMVRKTDPQCGDDCGCIVTTHIRFDARNLRTSKNGPQHGCIVTTNYQLRTVKRMSAEMIADAERIADGKMVRKTDLQCGDDCGCGEGVHNAQNFADVNADCGCGRFQKKLDFLLYNLINHHYYDCGCIVTTLSVPSANVVRNFHPQTLSAMGGYNASVFSSVFCSAIAEINSVRKMRIHCNHPRSVLRIADAL